MKKLEMEFVSAEAFMTKTLKEKIKFILSNIRKNKIIVLDGVLDPEEEMKLIEETMKRIDGTDFTGIEIYSMRKEAKGYKALVEKVANSLPTDKLSSILSKLLKREVRLFKPLRDGLTLIGPSKIVKQIKKEKNSFRVLAEV